MRGRVRAQGGTRGSPRMRRSRRQSPVTRAGEGRGGGARGVGTRRARGYSAVDGHRRDAREGKRRGDRGRGVGGGGGAARRVRRRRRGRGVLEECGGKGICRRGLYDFRPETRRFGFGCVGCVGCVFGRRDGAREGRRTYLGRGSVRRSGGGARGASRRARRRRGRVEGREEREVETIAGVNRSCVPVACTSRAYQSCVPVVCTSRVYQSFQWWRWRDERSMRARRGFELGTISVFPRLERVLKLSSSCASSTGDLLGAHTWVRDDAGASVRAAEHPRVPPRE